MRSQASSASTALSGRSCEVRDGLYTGRALRALHAGAKADCLREVAEREGLDLAECTAYSDSHTDLPFLEAVGHPVAVNPDRELRRIAADRGWPVLQFASGLPARAPARPLSCSAAAGAAASRCCRQKARGR